MLEHDCYWWRKEAFKSKQYVTARDEYLNINDYWIKNTNIFVDHVNNNFTIDKNIINNNNLENICFDNLIKILKNENHMLLSKEITNELITGGEEVKINEDPPISEEKILKFFKDLTEGKKTKNQIIIDAGIKDGTEFATAVEYMCNVAIYMKNKKNTKMTFSEMCNTTLDSELYPIRHAPGGRADDYLEFEDFNVVIETTTLDKTTTLRKNEVESIERHTKNIYLDRKKTTAAVILLPKLNYEYVQSIYNSFINSNWFDSKNQAIDFDKDKVGFSFNIFDFECIFNKIEFKDKDNVENLLEWESEKTNHIISNHITNNKVIEEILCKDLPKLN